MTLAATETGPVPAVTRWVRGLWGYYRGYTHSPVHTASAAALTIFGLLVFVDPLFAVLAIASYVCPPIVLYAVGADVGTDSRESNPASIRADSASTSNDTIDRNSPGHVDDGGSDGHDGDSDSDSDDGDSDSDGIDADADDADSDADADGVDTDTDSDG